MERFSSPWIIGGRRAVAGDWVAVDRDADYVIEISTGALFPGTSQAAISGLPIDVQRALKEQLHIMLDGRTLLRADLATFESEPHDVAVGLNLIGSSSAQYRFSGNILSIERVPLPTP